MDNMNGQEVKRNQLFAVYDEKAETYGPPISHPTINVAIRSFTAACSNPDSFLAKFPSDYALYCIGHYDERTAIVQSINPPQFIVRASEILNKETQPQLQEVESVSD